MGYECSDVIIMMIKLFTIQTENTETHIKLITLTANLDNEAANVAFLSFHKYGNFHSILKVIFQIGSINRTISELHKNRTLCVTIIISHNQIHPLQIELSTYFSNNWWFISKVNSNYGFS